MASVNPAACAMAANAAFSQGRPGRPNETFDRPRIVRQPNRPEHHRTVSSVSCAARGLAATVMTRPSTTISSFRKPYFFASRKTPRMMFLRRSAVSGTSPPARGSRMNMAPYRAAIGSNLSMRSRSPEMEFTRARPG